MHKIIVTKITLNRMVVVGFFGEDGGESKLTLALSANLFPENIKIGDEVTFHKKAKLISIERSAT